MNKIDHRFALPLATLAAALALAACDRGERIPTAQSDAPPAGTAPMAPSTTSADAGSAGSTMSGSGTSAAGAVSASTAPLPPTDSEFVTKAAEGGQFEVEVAKLAIERASDPAVKSFAQMLVDDHSAANDKLRQIATSHNVALPASLPDDKKKQLEQLAKLSGQEFDRQFVKMIGIKDHHHDIGEFEKAGKEAKSDDVKSFAQSTLPTLKKHLAAAEKLPGARG
ncbi:MAG TPA: DUF4142 domain-containing protein [Albitalea sp.]|jgi:putative membrane protein|nr:DUF4142 domain-containing protein [Albitalea sp.]